MTPKPRRNYPGMGFLTQQEHARLTAARVDPHKLDTKSRIHGSVPKKERKKISPDHWWLKQQIWQLLKAEAQGHENAITTDAIATRLQIEHTRTNELVRALAGELIEVDFKPIMSDSCGMYVGITEEDRAAALENVDKHIRGLFRRRKNLKRMELLGSENELDGIFGFMGEDVDARAK